MLAWYLPCLFPQRHPVSSRPAHSWISSCSSPEQTRFMYGLGYTCFVLPISPGYWSRPCNKHSLYWCHWQECSLPQWHYCQGCADSLCKRQGENMNNGLRPFSNYIHVLIFLIHEIGLFSYWSSIPLVSWNYFSYWVHCHIQWHWQAEIFVHLCTAASRSVHHFI